MKAKNIRLCNNYTEVTRGQYDVWLSVMRGPL